MRKKRDSKHRVIEIAIRRKAQQERLARLQWTNQLRRAA